MPTACQYAWQRFERREISPGSDPPGGAHFYLVYVLHFFAIVCSTFVRIYPAHFLETMVFVHAPYFPHIEHLQKMEIVFKERATWNSSPKPPNDSFSEPSTLPPSNAFAKCRTQSDPQQRVS